ncbi:MAG: L,D-transpeptidase [Acidimicrobiales bacterium]
MSRRVAAVAVTVLLLTVSGSTTHRTATLAHRPMPVAQLPPTSPPTTTQPLNVVATARVPSVGVWDSPGQGDAARRLDNPTKPYGTPLVFLVREQEPDWLRVLLPVRPNGSMGWIRRADVDMATHDYRIKVELGAHRITVWKGNAIFDQEPIGVGTNDTPTPGGLYYTKELLQPVDSRGRLIPDGPYGPYAYGLSGYSDVLYNFAGGDGVIGIHGTNDPTSVGQDVSHGCIRMTNDAITRLATTLPIGVPVEIAR